MNNCIFLIMFTSAFVTLCCPALVSVHPYCESFSQLAVAGIFRYRYTVIYFIPQGDLSRCQWGLCIGCCKCKSSNTALHYIIYMSIWGWHANYQLIYTKSPVLEGVYIKTYMFSCFYAVVLFYLSCGHFFAKMYFQRLGVKEESAHFLEH